MIKIWNLLSIFLLLLFAMCALIVTAPTLRPQSIYENFKQPSFVVFFFVVRVCVLFFVWLYWIALSEHIFRHAGTHSHIFYKACVPSCAPLMLIHARCYVWFVYCCRCQILKYLLIYFIYSSLTPPHPVPSIHKYSFNYVLVWRLALGVGAKQMGKYVVVATKQSCQL